MKYIFEPNPDHRNGRALQVSELLLDIKSKVRTIVSFSRRVSKYKEMAQRCDVQMTREMTSSSHQFQPREFSAATGAEM